MRTTTATVHRAVYRTDGDASVNLCVLHIHIVAWSITTKRIEQNLFVRSGKSEAKVTDNNRRSRSTYCTIEANY